ncbi:MAG: MBL fold metallo-hydrolase [Actinomycetota bacterium]|nr:MBL fold metallo-hydrolase [Actinomycetota bacterium]
MAETYQVTDETFVISDSLPVPGVGVLPINAMVIRGEQPMILDTMATVQRDEFLDKVFSIVEPADVRWLFLSHEDRDHSGSLMQVLERCPNATLITNFLGLGKLGEEFAIPLDRVRLMNDGDTLDIGDRTVAALRPPLYDSSATRGLWDPKTKTYFAADCFGSVMATNVQFSDEVAPTDYEEGFFWMNRVNHIWHQHVAQDKIDAAAHRIRTLGADRIVSGHGPVDRTHPDTLCDWISRIGDMEPVELPSQADFEAMLAGGPE